MADPTLEKFIGKGITFPLKFDANGSAIIDSDTNLLRASIIQILSWPYRTRFFLHNYGTRLFDLIEEPNDEITKTLVRRFVIDSLSNWENRVELLDIQIVDATNEKINILLNYKVSNTQVQDTFVFPFYKDIIY